MDCLPSGRGMLFILLGPLGKGVSGVCLEHLSVARGQVVQQFIKLTNDKNFTLIQPTLLPKEK